MKYILGKCKVQMNVCTRFTTYFKQSSQPAMQGNITLLWQNLLYTIYMYRTLPSIRGKHYGFGLINKRQRKLKGQSRMDNPEIQEILGKRHRTKSNKAKRHNTEN